MSELLQITERPRLEYSEEVAEELLPLYQKVRDVIPPMEWAFHAPYIKAINELKKERNAVILAHNYMGPEIFHGVGDFRGDSLQLAIEAGRTDAEIIVQAGVHFMAETSKLMNPEKLVLMPDMEAGCSLAESITAEDVRLLREQQPGLPIVTYINTSAAVKAECDVTCTSANAANIVRRIAAEFGTREVIMLPDEYLAKNIAAELKAEGLKLLIWQGHCEVHERFRPEDLRTMRGDNPGLKIVAHPECPPDVIKEADFAGSTSAMIRWIEEKQPKKVMLVTECSMSANIAVTAPSVRFIRPCNLCPHMKRITLQNILDSLLYLRNPIEIDENIVSRARAAVERMIRLS
ncbi:quinolinate synthase NadA [Candidatus Haliotispira prima]|uniref:Quinolinate synthase n=1 Tax=Candidatus Haliotispira prima TaxID=3034016 RepID=A0ABY8MIV4_9SPIO|nr:quinolinate synthase NadA [Candidatus Haliotispira prima]